MSSPLETVEGEYRVKKDSVPVTGDTKRLHVYSASGKVKIHEITNIYERLREEIIRPVEKILITQMTN